MNRKHFAAICVITLITQAGCQLPSLLLPPTQAEPTPTLDPVEPSATVSIPEPISTATPSPLPTTTPSPMPEFYATININQIGQATIYWKRDLWESAVDGQLHSEDFELDTADYGAIPETYLTGNAWLLQGSKEFSGQILNDGTLLKTGNVLHFRDFGEGMKVTFPDETSVRAFAFEYKASEDWRVQTYNFNTILPAGRGGFFGVILSEGDVTNFTLFTDSEAQGGLTIDNLSYIK